MPADLLTLGEPLVEFNQLSVKDPSAYRQGFGGDISNVAIAASRQGARSGVVTAVGDDAHGALLRDLWRREGVEDGLTTTSTAPTGIYFVTHGATGHTFSFMRKGSAASKFGPKDLPVDALRDARMLHLSGITLAISGDSCDAGMAAMRVAREAGVAVSFDTNLRLKLWGRDRARAMIMAALQLCDIALPSLDDMIEITGLSDPDKLVDLCLDMGAGVVALKLGSRGALVADADGRHHIPPLQVQAVDATGAGDCFAGAFLARRLAGDRLAEAARYASVCAALSTTGYGAVSPIPLATKVRARLADLGDG